MSFSLKINKKELLVEGIMWILILLMAAYWSSNARTLVGKFVSSFNVLASCVFLPYYISNRLITPLFLIGRKFNLYFLFTLLIILVNPIFAYILNNYIDYYIWGTKRLYDFDTISRSLYVLLWNTLLAVTLGTGIRLVKHYFVTDKQIQELEKQRIKAELDFLRSQINPHFLFNVMNTVYFQIDKTNFTARNSVEKFARLLRYQIQVSDKETVPVEQEIDFIQNYCMLQKLRLEEGTNITINIDPDLKGFNIAPLLFIALVENAFKYISHHTIANENFIDISLSIENKNYLSIKVINSTDSSDNNDNGMAQKSNGLGLSNLKKRLKLIYPDSYTFSTQKNEYTFEVYLSIKCIP